MAKKTFKELTPQGQTRRLNKYKKEHEARGTEQILVRAALPVIIKEIAGGNKQAIFRFAENKKGEKDTKFFTATAFIKAGKDSLEKFYASITVGQLLSLEYKQNGKYINIYNLIDRSYADKRRKKKEEEALPA